MLLVFQKQGDDFLFHFIFEPAHFIKDDVSWLSDHALLYFFDDEILVVIGDIQPASSKTLQAGLTLTFLNQRPDHAHEGRQS